MTDAIAAHALLREHLAQAESSGAQMENQKLATDVTCPHPTAEISRWPLPAVLPSVAISNSSRVERRKPGATCSVLSDSNSPSSSTVKHKRRWTAQRRAYGPRLNV